MARYVLQGESDTLSDLERDIAQLQEWKTKLAGPVRHEPPDVCKSDFDRLVTKRELDRFAAENRWPKGLSTRLWNGLEGFAHPLSYRGIESWITKKSVYIGYLCDSRLLEKDGLLDQVNCGPDSVLLHESFLHFLSEKPGTMPQGWKPR